MKRLVLLLLLLPLAAQAEILTHGRFAAVQIEHPPGPVRSFAVLLTGHAGEGAALAPALAQQGALVAVVETEAFFETMEADGSECQFANGDLQNLSHTVQAYAHLDRYYRPILVGRGLGAGFVYGLLAQSGADSFAAGLAIDFCPELAMRKPLCRGEGGLKARRGGRGYRYQPTPLRAPLAVLQPLQPRACAAAPTRRWLQQVPQAAVATLEDPAQPWRVAAAYSKFAARYAPPAPAKPASVADLPIVELPAQGSAEAYAVFISGDGGWAGIDQEVASRLAARGVPVIGLDSLRYFWQEQTPESAAQDVARLIRAYGARWPGRKAWLVGYSQGGDVLPFILNRLPADVRAQVARAVPMAMGEQAHFEFHLSNWLGSQGTHPILPEMQRLADSPMLTAVCAEDEDESVCKQLDAQHHQLVWLPGGHHFNGDYQRLADIILGRAAP